MQQLLGFGWSDGRTLFDNIEDPKFTVVLCKEGDANLLSPKEIDTVFDYYRSHNFHNKFIAVVNGKKDFLAKYYSIPHADAILFSGPESALDALHIPIVDREFGDNLSLPPLNIDEILHKKLANIRTALNYLGICMKTTFFGVDNEDTGDDIEITANAGDYINEDAEKMVDINDEDDMLEGGWF